MNLHRFIRYLFLLVSAVKAFTLNAPVFEWPARPKRERRWVLSKAVPTWLTVCFLAVLTSGIELSAQPIRLHPDNPHYFLFRGQPTVLITHGEHYGSVVNLDFNYPAYLDHMQSKGMNLTRLFSGAYLEYPGFNGTAPGQNTIAPEPNRLVVPWARSSSPGYAGGGNKFDLNVWDPNYFARLHDFVQQAGNRGVVVEVVLFSMMYDEGVWQQSPLNAINNINGVGVGSSGSFLTLADSVLLERQLALARKIVQELRGYDNVYFEVANEPDTTIDQRGVDWHNRIIQEIVAAESGSTPHMIAVDYETDYSIQRLHPAVSVHNSHYTWGESPWVGAVELLDRYFHADRALGFDESWPPFYGGYQNTEGARVEAWEFLVGGGGVYSGLSLEFTNTAPSGSARNDTILHELRVLKDFLNGFDFLRMSPQKSLVTGVPGNAQHRVLAEAGRQYAIYLHQGERGSLFDMIYNVVHGSHRANLTVDLPAGSYQAQWVDPASGSMTTPENFTHSGGGRTFLSPAYTIDVALSIRATGANPVPPQTVPPSVPTGLTATTVSSSAINLSWTASTDDIAVAGYRIFRDGVAIATSSTTTYRDSGLAANTSYAYSVSALDGANNESGRSGNASARTFAASTVPAGNGILMPLGDSLTYGYVYESSPNNNEGGYRKYLWERIVADGFNVNFVGSLNSGIPGMDRDHEGHIGWRTIDLATIINSSLATYSPDTILLLIGTNDLNEDSTPQQTLNNVGALLDQIHTARPAARILLANNPGVRVNNDYPGITPQEVNEFNAGLPSVINNRTAQGRNITLVDLYGRANLDRTSSSNHYSPDGLHFSLAGYSKLATAWYDALYPGSGTIPSTPAAPPVAPPPANLPSLSGLLNLPLNEGTGTSAADVSGNGNHGTLLNGPAWTTGTSGGALNFDGVNDVLYVNNPSSFNSVRTGLTVAVWVNRNSSPSGLQSVLSRQVGDTFYEHYFLGFENGNFRWSVNTTSGYSDYTAGSAAPAGQWVHVAGTYDGSNVRLYVNGVLDFTRPMSGTFAADFTGIAIGANHNDASHAPGEGFNGRIDDVRIYAGALTAADVVQLYRGTNNVEATPAPGVPPPPPVAAPPVAPPPATPLNLPSLLSLALNEGSGTSAADASGNGNNAALLNGATWTTGRSGGAANFDGINDVLYVNNSSSLNSVSTGVTVAAWVYRNANQSGLQAVVSRQVGDTYFEQYFFGFENGKYQWAVNTTSGYSNFSFGSMAPTGQWVHMVGTYDGSTARFYVNGVLDFATPHSGTFVADSTGIVIGAGHNDGTHVPNEAFNGRIDDVRIYNRALTAADVVQLHQGGSGETTPAAPAAPPVTAPPVIPPPVTPPPANPLNLPSLLILPLDEGTGTSAADASGNENHGTLLDGPVWTTGRSEGALNFDGINDVLYVNSPSSFNSVSAGLTVAVWVNRNSSPGGLQSVLSRQVGDTYYDHYFLGFENGNYRWAVNTTNGYSDYTAGSAAPAGQWVHLVGTYDGSNVRLYVNGVLDFTRPIAGTFAADFTGIAIGANHNDASHVPGEGFAGRIDDVRIYNSAMTAADVAQLYQKGGGL